MNETASYNEVVVTTVYENTSQELIKITDDKLCRILMKHGEDFERKREWHTPLGLVLALVVTFATTEFHDFAWIKAATWQAIFIVSFVLLLWWLGKAGWRAKHSPTVEDLLAKIKKGG